MFGNSSKIIMVDSSCIKCAIPMLVNSSEWKVPAAHVCVNCSAPHREVATSNELEKALDEIYGNEELDWEDLEIDNWEVFGEEIPTDLLNKKENRKPKCDCGAVHTEFPDLHYKWCELLGKKNA